MNRLTGKHFVSVNESHIIRSGNDKNLYFKYKYIYICNYNRSSMYIDIQV